MTDPIAIDRETGEVVELPDNDLRRENLELRQQVERLRESMGIELEEKRKLRAKVSQLTGERNAKREMDPYFDDCSRVYEAWNTVTMPSAKEFGEKRYAVVRARMSSGGYSADDLIRAATKGVQGMPADIKAGQRKQMSELEYVCRNEKNVDMFLGWADRSEPEVAPVSQLPARRRDPWSDFVTAFKVCPSTAREPTAVGYVGFCQACVNDPRVGGAGLSSVVTMSPDGAEMVCERGCSSERQVDALLEWYRHSGRVSCPECFGRVKKDDNGRTWRAAA